MIEWRPATHEDLPRIKELWDEQESRFSDTQSPVDRPTLFYEPGETERPFYPFRPPIVNVEVAERDGVITGFRYGEAIVEVCVVTGDEETMKSLGDNLTRFAHWAKQHGFRSGWGLVPEKFAGAMGRFLRKYPHIRVWRSLTPVGIDFKELGD